MIIFRNSEIVTLYLLLFHMHHTDTGIVTAEFAESLLVALAVVSVQTTFT